MTRRSPTSSQARARGPGLRPLEGERSASSQAYWATASGYQMSQIFVELWEATRQGAVSASGSTTRRARKYIADVHDRVREHLEKALEGHRMNVELAKAYGVETTWSKGSEQQAVQIMKMLADDSAGHYVTPSHVRWRDDGRPHGRGDRAQCRGCALAGRRPATSSAS